MRTDRTRLPFRCRGCRREFNERTGTRFNHLQYPTDIVCVVVRWRVRYKLSLRDLAEMFLERGVAFTHEAVREREAQFAPLLSERLRKQFAMNKTFAQVKRGFSTFLNALRFTSTKLCWYWPTEQLI